MASREEKIRLCAWINSTDNRKHECANLQKTVLYKAPFPKPSLFPDILQSVHKVVSPNPRTQRTTQSPLGVAVGLGAAPTAFTFVLALSVAALLAVTLPLALPLLLTLTTAVTLLLVLVFVLNPE